MFKIKKSRTVTVEEAVQASKDAAAQGLSILTQIRA